MKLICLLPFFLLLSPASSHHERSKGCKIYDLLRSKSKCISFAPIVDTGSKLCKALDTEDEPMRTFTSSGLQTLVCARNCLNNYVNSFLHSNPRFHENEQFCDQLAKSGIAATRMCYRNCQACKLKIRDVGSTYIYKQFVPNYC